MQLLKYVIMKTLWGYYNTPFSGIYSYCRKLIRHFVSHMYNNKSFKRHNIQEAEYTKFICLIWILSTAFALH